MNIKRYIAELVFLGLFCGVLGWTGGFQYGKQQEYLKINTFPAFHEHCRDTKTEEAWIAKKENIYRCFMEKKEYPHRARGTHIEYDTSTP